MYCVYMLPNNIADPTLPFLFVCQGATYEGVGFEGKICGVSILRAGEVRFLMIITHNLTYASSGDGSWTPRGLSQCAHWEDFNPEGAHHGVRLQKNIYISDPW